MQSNFEFLRPPAVGQILRNATIGASAKRSFGRTVYQYTSFRALRSMLGGDVIDDLGVPPGAEPRGEIWATSAKFMNDTREFEFGRELLLAQIDGLPRTAQKELLMKSIAEVDALDSYCACFSALDDDLSQWRGYGDDGRGVCLGFSVDEFERLLPGAGLWVQYGDNPMTGDIAGRIVSYVHAAVSPYLHQQDEVLQILRAFWPPLCLAFKHEAFSSEQEYRLVYSPSESWSIATSFRGPSMVPFVRLRVETLPLTSVRLGPGVVDTESSVRRALSARSLPNVHVMPSRIPYIPR